MDNGSFFYGLVGLPILLGMLVGGLFAFLVTAWALNLGLTKLVALIVDSLRARRRTSADER
jgi:hypothetical protein